MFIPPMGFLFVHLFPLSSKYVLFLSGFDVICTVIVLFCVFLHRNMDICLCFIIPSIVGCVNDVRCLFFTEYASWAGGRMFHTTSSLNPNPTSDPISTRKSKTTSTCFRLCSSLRSVTFSLFTSSLIYSSIKYRVFTGNSAFFR